MRERAAPIPVGALAALLAILLSSVPLAPVAASAADTASPSTCVDEATTRSVEWVYTVTVPSDGSGVAAVEVQLVGALGLVSQVILHPREAAAPVNNLEGIDLRANGANDTLSVQNDDESFTFSVDLNAELGTSGPFFTYVGPSWGLIRAEDFAIPFDYTYSGVPPSFCTQVTFTLPAAGPGAPAWRSATAWSPLPTANSYALPAGEALPRGFVVVGAFNETDGTAGGRTIRFVDLGPGNSTFAPDLFNILGSATPWDDHTFGDVPGPTILVVGAPDPLDRAGFGDVDSMYAYKGSSALNISEAYTRVWERFGGVDAATNASIWFPEGLSVLEGTLSLAVSGAWSLDALNGWFATDARNASGAPANHTPLSSASYETGGQEVAREKGALALEYLDELIQTSTSGRIGLPDVLAALNAQATASGDTADTVTNAQLLAVTESLTGKDFAPFFRTYIDGAALPPGTAQVADGTVPLFRAAGQIVVSNLTSVPAQPIAGVNATVVATFDNRGLAPAQGNFTLTVDGHTEGRVWVSLGLAGRSIQDFHVVAPIPGSHQLAIGLDSVPWTIEAPATLVPGGVTTVPAAPTAKSVTQMLVGIDNPSPSGAAGMVVLLVDGNAIGSKNVTVPGNDSSIVDFPVTYDTPGPHLVTIRVYADESFYSRNLTLAVAPPAPSGPSGPLQEIQSAVPGMGLAETLAGLVLVSAVGSASLGRRGRARR